MISTSREVAQESELGRIAMEVLTKDDELAGPSYDLSDIKISIFEYSLDEDDQPPFLGIYFWDMYGTIQPSHPLYTKARSLLNSTK